MKKWICTVLISGIFIALHTGGLTTAYPADSYSFGVVPQYDQRQLHGRDNEGEI